MKITYIVTIEQTEDEDITPCIFNAFDAVDDEHWDDDITVSYVGNLQMRERV